jgi:hypothetical protein
LGPAPAAGALPDAAALLADLGLSPDDGAKIRQGQIVHHDIQPASERELVAALAFLVPVAPAALIQEVRAGLGNRTDPSTLSSGPIGANPSADLAKLKLQPDGATRAKAYGNAAPGEALNLSTAEIAAFDALGPGAAPSVVEPQVRSALLARLQSYQAQGLAGIAPYARADGERSVADELRTATLAGKALEKYAPAAYQLLISYPQGKPAGTEESFRWSQFDAHGTPTIALTQGLFIPDGDAWIVLQRQFYVSTGYNCEQAVAVFLPVQGGTVVVYGNRTSTDQITGFGGGAKRSIGSKVLASQLESMFEKARAAAK